MPEFLIIMNQRARKQELARVIEAVKSTASTVPLLYPPRVMIGRGRQNIAKKIADKKLTGLEAVYLADKKPFPLDSVGRKSFIKSLKLGKKGSSAVRSWIERNSREYRDRKAALKTFEGRTIDDDIPGSIVALNGGAPAMKGLCVVSIIIVNGLQYGVEITSDEVANLETEVQEGCDQLKFQASSFGADPDLNFVFDDVRTVDLAVDPAAITRHDQWRDAAMNKLGGQTISDYIEDRRRNYGANWGCIAFFSMYMNSVNPAYAYPLHSIFRYLRPSEPSGWRSDELDRIFAHELGHICGARHDESNDCLMSNSGVGWQICPTTATAFKW